MIKNSSEFVKALLTQESALRDSEFSKHRRKLLDRLAAAEQREHQGRSVVIGAAVGVIIVWSVLAIMALRQIGDPNSWPEPAMYAFVLAILLLPISAILLTATYFFRHRRELGRARDEVYRSALTDLPRQIEELRRQMDELRQQLPKSQSSAGTGSGK